MENLYDERRYLLDQKAKHLEASLQAGKNTHIDDIDADILHRDISSLKNKVDNLYNKSNENSRRLEVIPEENPNQDNSS